MKNTALTILGFNAAILVLIGSFSLYLRIQEERNEARQKETEEEEPEEPKKRTERQELLELIEKQMDA